MLGVSLTRCLKIHLNQMAFSCLERTGSSLRNTEARDLSIPQSTLQKLSNIVNYPAYFASKSDDQMRNIYDTCFDGLPALNVEHMQRKLQRSRRKQGVGMQSVEQMLCRFQSPRGTYGLPK